MAVRDEAITTGTEKQADLRKRTAGQVPQTNAGYTTKDVQEKTKQKVCYHWDNCYGLFWLERDGYLDGRG